jgi:hypothetical protein
MDVTYSFCTYLDRHYLPRGLALVRSLQRHCPDFRLWLLCLDAECYSILSQLQLLNVRPIALEALEAADAELAAVKPARSRVEYYFTCTPALPLHVLQRNPQIELITYLDADLFFYADPAPLFAELDQRSVGIIEHRYPPHLASMRRCGIYNVGWVSFRRDAAGLACLHWWRERCLEWCFDRCEPGRYADQKYLDDWPERFANVAVLRHPGANVGPWNAGRYRFSRGRQGVYVAGQPLLFYHFHALKQVQSWLFHADLTAYGVQPSGVLRADVYYPYIRAVAEEARRLSAWLPAETFCRTLRFPEAQRFGPNWLHRLSGLARDAASLFRRRIRPQYFWALGPVRCDSVKKARNS